MSRWLLWVPIIAGAMAFGVFGLISLAIAPQIAAVNTFLCALYIAVVIYLLRRSSLWPRSGRAVGWVSAGLLWGAGTCLVLVLVAGDSVMQLAEAAGWDASLASWGGAYPEEISKALGILLICLSFRQLNRPWHAMITGMVIGLGFEVSENAMYAVMGAQMDPVSDWFGFWQTWGTRMIFGPGLHILFSALAGWGIGWALFAAGWSVSRRVGYALGWLFLAFAAHFTWNYAPTHYWISFITMGLVAICLYPGVFFLWRQAGRHAANDAGYSQASTLRTVV